MAIQSLQIAPRSRFTDKQLYKMKNELLAERMEQVTPTEFYRDVFPEGSLGVRGEPEIQRPNMIFTMVEKDDTGEARAFNRLVFDDLEDLSLAKGAEFAVASPVSYRGRNRTAANGHHLWGFCIDLDGVKMEQLRDLLYQIRNGILPEPTYIVNSGHGLHLYYLLEAPIPLYRHLHKPLDKLKYALTTIIWNRYTSEIDPEKRQYQGIFQGFRMPGTQSKLGKRYPVVAFRFGNKTSIDTLNKYVEPEYRILDLDQQRIPLEEAKWRFPDWYERRIVQKDLSRGKWDIAGKVHGDNPHALYDWWVELIHNGVEGAFDGNRYNCIATLMTYAVKCDVDKEKVLNDALAMVPWLNSLTETPKNEFTVQDVYDAYTYYSDTYATYSIRAIEAKTKIRIKRNKRNGRSQAEHLKRARALLEVDYPDGAWRNKKGRPKGSGTAAAKVAAFRADHPEATVAEAAKALGLSRTTVYKWWQGLDTQAEKL